MSTWSDRGATPLPKALLFDLDGVFYVDDQAIPGAAEVLADLQHRTTPHLLLTNTSSRPRSALVDKLANMDIDVDAERILTPAVAAGHWLRAHASGPVALFCDPHTATDLGDVTRLASDAESGAGAVVVGDLGSAWDFATLNRAFRLLMDETRPALIALGMTRYWRAEDGLRLDTAPFVRALEHAADVKALVMGKPAPAFFEMALSRLGVTPAETLMIGDDIRSDIDGAQSAGVRGVLVRTGKFRPSDLEGPVNPFAILDTIAELQTRPDLWPT